MTRENALAFAKSNIESLEYRLKFHPPEKADIEFFKDLSGTLKAFIETDRKYEALKITSNIGKEPTG